jgi:outer membrane protein assembly factor BamB
MSASCRLLPVLLMLLCARTAPAGDAAREILKTAGVSGGLVVHVGCGDGKLTSALAPDDHYVVHGLAKDDETVRRAREDVLALGRHGQVSIGAWDGKRLPYADRLVNLLVVDGAETVPAGELQRVIAPGGVALVRKGNGWTKTVRPWPETLDTWSHHLHAADGNPVARDRVVGPPARFQWLSGPQWQRAHDTDANVNALVSAGGRLFYLVDEAPIGLPGANGLPDKWLLTARDAFNGILLWQIPVKKWGWREYKDSHYRSRHDVIPVNVHRRVVADADHVYATLGMDAPVSRIDAATGRVLHVYAGSEGTREILLHDGELLLTVPAGERLKLLVVNAATGVTSWETPAAYAGTIQEKIRIQARRDPVLHAAADGASVCLLDGTRFVCLDRRTGAERWSVAHKTSAAPAGRKRKKNRSAAAPGLWAGTLILHDGVLLYAEPGVLKALSSQDGKTFWEVPISKSAGLWFKWKDVFVIDGLVWTWSGEGNPLAIHGYDLKSGERKKEIPLGPLFKVDHHHRCYRNKATSRYVIASRRGAEYVDLTGGGHSVHHWVRGICHLGMMPANGLLYAPPEPCKCYWYERISDFCALAPAAPSGESKDAAAPPLRKGPAFGDAAGPAAGPGDWPAFRGGAERSGATTSPLPASLRPAWRVRLAGRLTAPVAVGDAVYVASQDAYTVHALSAKDGQEFWRHAAGARIDSPPTYVRGKVIFGSRDGAVTCLRTGDGTVAWRFHAAPRRRLIGAHSRLESAWPVSGSVLAHGGALYFAAGRSSYLDGGILLYKLDPATGKEIAKTRLRTAPADLSDESWYAGYRDTGGRGALADVLMARGNRICMRNRTFDGDLKEQDGPGPDRIHALAGFLHDTHFKRYFWFYGAPMEAGLYGALAKPTIAKEHMRVGLGRLLVEDADFLYGVRMFDSMKLLNANNYFVPGKEGTLLYKVGKGREEAQWTCRIPILVNAMAVGPDRVAVAGPPDVVDPADPFGAYEHRKGGVLRLVDAKSGKTVQERVLEAAPVVHGIAAFRGRLVVTCHDGSICAFAE